MKNRKYTIGIDFGTDSVRTIVTDSSNGHIVGNAIAKYERWAKGMYCNPTANQFRQHPLDYIESLKQAVKEVIATLSSEIVNGIAAISVATTGSTPVAVNKNGVPLALLPGFEENPHGMFILWKDHTAIGEAKEINELAHNGSSIDYTKYSGGEYSSEWFWAKILHTLRVDNKVREAAHSWVEHCDWIPALLTGNTDLTSLKRSRCAAGHKAMWHPDWKGLPADDFWTQLDPLLSGLRDRLYTDTYTSDHIAGNISEEWSQLLGLPKDVVIGVGSFDAHIGAIGGAIKPYHMVKVIGTSTCDMIVAPKTEIGNKAIHGICGQVDGSILPNMIGLEAGQSAFGDLYAWFRDILMWPANKIIRDSKLLDEATKGALLEEMTEGILSELSHAASKITIEESGIIALDWMNGRRTPNSNQNLKGALQGLTLGTTAPNIFRALVEATAFGSKKIIDQFQEEGVRIDGVIAIGGVAQKSEFVMQILADVLNFPIRIIKSEQTCALGAAMAAAVVAGLYDSIMDAQDAMGSGFQKEYYPVPENVEKYKTLYTQYSTLADFVEAQQLQKD
ncbi:ribulokinase [Arenibacter sp. TNZ]|jgi:L-ribulokinase|uniref:ribulokinase n=1 Tax=Arenibacter TaxID=178469 RepID=UPI000CD3BC86|nr:MULTISPECIES: ribulokinase [Arenibacter]MCM4171529.1 ribulokinase [Arenibacter sp. TNZ]